MGIGFQFLSAPPDASLLYVGFYNPTWVVISVLLAILGSYAALRASRRIAPVHDTVSRLTWTSISALTMGAGVWAMHFIGMLALSLPCRVHYDPLITIVSMIPGILAGGVALGLGWHGTRHLSPPVSSVLLGAGIGTMHYTGMAAMRLDGFVRYDPSLFVLSILIAILLAYIALRIKNGKARLKKGNDVLVAVAMGAAVSGMHYTAMSAAYFVRGDASALAPSVFTSNTLAIFVTATTAFLVMVALALAAFSRNREVTDQLRDSEQRFRDFSSSTADWFWEMDADLRFSYFSDNFERNYGLSPDRVLGKTRRELLATDNLNAPDIMAAHLAQIERHEPFRDYHYRIRDAGGRICWFSISGVPVIDANGQFAGYRGMGQNITKQKQTEEQLHIAAAAFESQEGMLVTDADSVILRVNKAFTEITGYTAAEAVGQTPRLLSSGRHDTDFYRAMWEAIHCTGGWQGEIWDRRKNGEVYPKWLTISAVKNGDGVVTHYVGTHFDITERKKAEETINGLAFFDQLTGLPNRTLLLDRLKQSMAASARSGSYGALLFIDLDNFKTLNDTLGHEVGDQLLKQVAQRLKTCVREGDSVARLGGDEFVVVLAGLGPTHQQAIASIELVANKILAAFNQPYLLDDVAHHSTASIGATLFLDDVATIDALMKQADLAMYKSKSAGRNTLRFFDQDMEAVAMKRAALENDLRAAIKEKQFVLHYQAQVSDGRLMGSEVLVRWQHPRRGMVSPADFIPLAEETGAILPLGHWVLETACLQLAAWATQPEMEHLTVAVNVSAHQFRHNGFVDEVLAVLKNTGANPQRLKLELTESLLVANVEEVIEKMFALKAKGVAFSLDDFGTGYSSLSYLKRLPLDQLKIDRSFVRDVLTDPNDASIARTIIALGQNLGLGVIAEGVETEAQRDFLANSGCHAYQGYFFSRPLPIDEFERFLAQFEVRRAQG